MTPLARSHGSGHDAVPLALYVHLPWCLRKCPYCDFNSHRAPARLPEARYVEALLADLRVQAPRAAGRPVRSVFFGGGTPSLFSPRAIARVLGAARESVGLAAGAEITLEANPGAADAARFAGYLEAGVTRLSIGVQSFDDTMLLRIGRVHDAGDARAAISAAREAGFERLNLDLMYALPGQRVAEAATDLAEAVAHAPGHLSLYQLTLEPDTPFHRDPPELPDEESAHAMHEAGLEVLERAGYERYEISAYARPAERSAHNLNYWRFGDYLGVGAGAHGKLTDPSGRVVRTVRERHPTRYADGLLASAAPPRIEPVTQAELGFEFMLNAARLTEGFDLALFEARTGQGSDALEPMLARAETLGLVERAGNAVRPTARGLRFHNELVMLFLPEALARGDAAGAATGATTRVTAGVGAGGAEAPGAERAAAILRPHAP